MHASAAGFLLFLLGAIALAGFLTGNLDRWLAFLFTPTGTLGTGNAGGSISGAVTKAAPTPVPSGNQRSA